MRLQSHFLAAGVALLAASVILPSTPERTTELADAQVRFTNNATTTATVNADGEPLFVDVAAGTTTEWTALSDSTTTFSMRLPGEGKPPASVTQVIEDGARYTITGSVDAAGNPALSIKREAPMPPPDSTSGT